MSRDEHLAYAAGFFDGEGSVGLYPDGRGRYHLRVQVTQNCSAASSDVLMDFMARWGGNISVQNTSHGKKYNWQVNSANAANMLSDVKGYCRIKRSQVEAALEWWMIRSSYPASRNARGHFNKVRDPRDEEFATRLKQLKKG